MDLEGLKDLLREIKTSKAWSDFQEYLASVHARLQEDVWEARNWEEILELRGVRKALIAVMQYHESVEERITAVVEEEEHNG